MYKVVCLMMGACVMLDSGGIATQELKEFSYEEQAMCPDPHIVEGVDGWYKSYQVEIDECTGKRGWMVYDKDK